LLENQKLRDEVTDAQNALYPEQCTKEEAKAQIRGLSSALQRINQLLKIARKRTGSGMRRSSDRFMPSKSGEGKSRILANKLPRKTRASKPSRNSSTPH
jgi:hypothetical protein